MKATFQFFLTLLPAVFFIASTSTSAPLKFEAPCPTSFEAIPVAPEDTRPAIDRLVDLESQLEGLEKSRFATERKVAIAAIRSEYDRWADAVLSEKPEELVGFDDAFVALRTRLSEVSNLSSRSTAAATTSSLSYGQLIEQPELLKIGTVYAVPQASGQGGQASLHKVSVKFSQDVLDYFREDVQRGHRFLRAIQKGYVPGKSGSGIVRITDQHENLVEVKVIGGNEGHQRLIGCRHADGVISILKVYEKHNEGGGGALKKFASLCE